MPDLIICHKSRCKNVPESVLNGTAVQILHGGPSQSVLHIYHVLGHAVRDLHH